MIEHVRPQLGWPIVNLIHGESDANSIAAGRLTGKTTRRTKCSSTARLLDTTRLPTL